MRDLYHASHSFTLLRIHLHQPCLFVVVLIRKHIMVVFVFGVGNERVTDLSLRFKSDKKVVVLPLIRSNGAARFMSRPF